MYKNLLKMRKNSCKNTIKFSIGVWIGFIFAIILSNLILAPNSFYYKTSIIIDDNSYLSLFSDEEVTDINSEFFIGVIIKENHLEKAIAITETWGKNIEGRIKFFVDQNEVSTVDGFSEFSVESVKNLNTNSFESLIEIYNYMSVDYKKAYNFYILTNSDTYIQSKSLRQLIKLVNNNDLIIQTLFPNFQSNIFRKKRFDVICVDENTFIISRAALLLFRSVLSQCLSGSSFYWRFQNMDWQTCFQQVLGIPCSVPEKAENLIFNEKINFSLTYSSYEREFENAAFISPVNDLSMFILHTYLKSLEIRKLETDVLNFQRERFLLLQQNWTEQENLSISSYTADDYLEGFFAEHLGSDLTSQDKLNCGYKTNFLEVNGNSREILEDSDSKLWNILSRENIETIVLNIQNRLPFNQTAAYVQYRMLSDYNEEENELIGSNVMFTAFRQCPSYGMQFNFGVREDPLRVKSKLVTCQVPFGPLWVRESPHKNFSEAKDILIFDEFKHYVNNEEFPDGVEDTPAGEVGTERIEMILALSGRSKTFERFMVNYELEVLIAKKNVGLTVSLYGPKDEERKANARLVSWYKEKYPGAPIFFIEGDTINSKSKALALATSDFHEESLLFIIDVDMIFKEEIFDRIRWFTIPGKQAYFPIIFTEYSPEVSREKKIGSEYEHFRYEEPFGFWREFGWGMVSIYQFDLVTVGGYDTTIVGWGDEDVDFSEKVLKSMNVIRVPEPGLVHVYHDKTCTEILTRRDFGKRGTSCMNSASNVFASSSKIAKSLVNNANIIKYYRRAYSKLALNNRRTWIREERRKRKASRVKQKDFQIKSRDLKINDIAIF